jgi:Fasciclin domain
VINRLNETAELTLFVPVDSAWNALHPIEKLYLESGFAADDLIRIFEMHAVVQHGVKWSDSFNPAINCQSFPPLAPACLTRCSDYSRWEAAGRCHYV